MDYPECKRFCSFTEEEWPCDECEAYIEFHKKQSAQNSEDGDGTP